LSSTVLFASGMMYDCCLDKKIELPSKMHLLDFVLFLCMQTAEEEEEENCENMYVIFLCST
jgi:hypothetical protein